MQSTSKKFPGPPLLGRGVVIGAGGEVPFEAAAFERVAIGDSELAEPQAVVERLHEAWLARRPVLIELTADPNALRDAETESAEPYELNPSFEFLKDRLQFLVWSNNYDARKGEPIWWWGRKAERLGATAGEIADVHVNGEDAWCDGGPRQPVHSLLLEGGALLHRDAIEAGSLRTDRQSSSAPDLAPDQSEAVFHKVGPCRIIAPAGSGKTRVLTERLRHLIGDLGWDRNSLCALAYNKRAADEMVERTADVRPHVRTLNSIALAIVNSTGAFSHNGEGRRLAVIDEPEVRRIIGSLVELPRALNSDPYANYIDGLRSIRLGLVDPSEAEAACDAPGLANLFDDYCTTLNDRNLVDFDGQLYEAIKVLLRQPDARANAQMVCRHLLVDEFQDLTPAHLLMVRLLSAPAYDVFGVGDDDQVIYGFGGATPEFLLEFARFFPGAAAHALTVNYRCPPKVVSAASSLLSYNQRRIAKSVTAAPSKTPADTDLAVLKVDGNDEAATSVAKLEEWRQAGLEWSDMAVLTRVNSTLLPVQVLLTQSGVPCLAAVDESILERTGTRTALAYLRIGAEPDRISRRDITETVRRPSRRIARNVSEMLTKKTTTSIREIQKLADYLSGSDAQRVADYASDLEMVGRAVRTGDTANALQVIRSKIGLGEAMETLDGSRREADRSTHADDLSALEQVAVLHADPATFEPWLRDVLRRRKEVGDNAVELSSIHRVKGREWRGVIVHGVDKGLMPHRLASDVSEERRLLHVAITRAGERCVVVADREQASDFLDEMNGTRPHFELSPDRPARAAAAVAKPKKEVRSVNAELGLNVRMAAGYEGELVELREDSALVSVDGARVTVRYGETVQIGKRSVVLLAPAEGEAIDPRLEVVVSALQTWRTEAAKKDKVPPYVVLSNVDVRTLAVALPKDLKQLKSCRGMGPIRLERWGDEILSVIEGARPG